MIKAINAIMLRLALIIPSKMERSRVTALIAGASSPK
jgi:hypothetical protein